MFARLRRRLCQYRFRYTRSGKVPAKSINGIVDAHAAEDVRGNNQVQIRHRICDIKRIGEKHRSTAIIKKLGGKRSVLDQEPGTFS